MKRLPALLLLFLSLPALAQPAPMPARDPAGTPASAQPAPPPSSEALAISILHHIGLVSQRDNHFTETRQLHALKTPLRQEGLLRFIPPDHVEKLTLAPVQERFILEGDMVQLQRGGGPVRALPLHMSPALQVMAATIRGPLQGDVALLQRYYTLTATGTLGHWSLTLTPKTEDTARIIRLVQLEGRNNVLEHSRLLQANGDVTDTAITPQ